MLNCQYMLIVQIQTQSLEAYEVWKVAVHLLAEFFILIVLSGPFYSKDGGLAAFFLAQLLIACYLNISWKFFIYQ